MNDRLDRIIAAVATARLELKVGLRDPAYLHIRPADLMDLQRGGCPISRLHELGVEVVLDDSLKPNQATMHTERTGPPRAILGLV